MCEGEWSFLYVFHEAYKNFRKNKLNLVRNQSLLCGNYLGSKQDRSRESVRGALSNEIYFISKFENFLLGIFAVTA